MQKQETAKFVFAFTTYTKPTLSQTEWEAQGVIHYEEIEWLQLKYIMLHFSSRKRTQQVKNILDSLKITTHKLGSEPSDITSFNVKDTMKSSVVHGMIQRYKSSEIYVMWATPKELAIDAVSAKANGKRKRDPVDRYKVPEIHLPVKPKQDFASYFSENELQNAEEQEDLSPAEKRQVLTGAVPVEDPALEQVEAPVVQAVFVDAPVVNLEAEVDKLRSVLAERDRLVEAQANHLADKDKQLADKNKQLAEKDKQLAERTRQIELLKAAL